MTHASLFSGIGGPEVAAQMLGWENIFHCEINPFGRAILEYHFPNSVSYEDITKTDFTRWNGRVDVLTGGFPCQPFSYAGKRGGANDDRYLWPQMLRAISECRPTWVVGENVAGITTMVEQSEIVTLGEQAALFGEADTLRSYELRQRFTIERVCTDLENIGYAVQPVLIPACAVGAPHRRDRVFIIAHSILGDTDNLNGRSAERKVRGREDTKSERVCQAASTSLPQDPVCGGQLVGLDGEQGSERNERNTCTRDSKRLRNRASRTEDGLATDTACDGSRASRANGKTKGKGRKLSQQGKRRKQTERTDGLSEVLRHAADTEGKPSKRCRDKQSCTCRKGEEQSGGRGREDGGLGRRWQGFPTVSPVHRGNDGLPFNVDDLTIPFNQWRTESLKAYGNAIVPQVMYEIFRAIEILAQK